MMTLMNENQQRHLEVSLPPQQRLQRNSWHAIFLSVHPPFPFLPLFLWQLRLDENHWHLHPPGISSITTSHNIPSNQFNYQSAITPTRLRTLLILMTDQRRPSQSTADKLPLIFTPSVFDASRRGAAAEMMDSPHIRGRMRICFSTLLMKSCCLLQCFSSKVASILFQTKCVCVFTPLYHYCHLATASFWVLFYLWPFCLGCISAVWKHVRSLV